MAQTLLERHLAACVQIVGPVESHYWWKGEREVAEEWLCLIKTTRRVYGQVEQVLRDVHTYELPEVTAVPIVAGSREYLSWLSAHAAGLP